MTPWLAAPEGIGQLVIMALLFVGWIIKEAAESSKRRKQQREREAAREEQRRLQQDPRVPISRTEERPPPRAPAPSTRHRPPGAPTPPDVVYGDRAIPHLPIPDHAPVAEVPSVGTAALGGLPKRASERGRLVPSLRAEDGGLLPAGVDEAAKTTASTATRRRRRALRRLRVGHVPGALRDKTRAALLWAEVLGPCRALRGPHFVTRRELRTR